jgi:hypothetical protein
MRALTLDVAKIQPSVIIRRMKNKSDAIFIGFAEQEVDL